MIKEIVVIEDNIDDAELIKLAIQRIKKEYKISVFYQGKQALDYLHHPEEKKGIFTFLILLDLRMEEMNGFQVLTELRRDTATLYTPVVVFSSSSLMPDLVNAYRKGANSYIEKPVDGSLFFETIEKTVLYWDEVNIFPYLKYD